MARADRLASRLLHHHRPGRLRRQYQEHIDRQISRLRGDPDREALRETQDRQQTIKRLEFERDHNLHLVEALGGGRYVTASPQDRRRIYQALRLRAEVDKEGQVRLIGIFSPSTRAHSFRRCPTT